METILVNLNVTNEKTISHIKEMWSIIWSPISGLKIPWCCCFCCFHAWCVPLISSCLLCVMKENISWRRIKANQKPRNSCIFIWRIIMVQIRGTQPEYSSKPLKRSIVERSLVFKMVDIGIFLSAKNFSSVWIS